MFHPVVEIQNLLATHGFSWRVSLGMQVILGEDLGAVLERNAIQQGLKNCPKLSRKECIQLMVFSEVSQNIIQKQQFTGNYEFRWSQKLRFCKILKESISKF